MNTSLETDRTGTSELRSRTAAPDETPTAQAAGTGEQMAGGNLDKIRDILFGAQSRDYERKFATLEERLLKESAELRNDLKRRFDSLEIYIKKEIEAVTDRVKAEQAERADSMKELAREVKDLSVTMDKKTGQLDDQAARAQRELRQQLLEQSKSLSEEIQTHHKDLSAALDQAVQQLRTEKTDRASLAALFMEASMRLNNEFKIPGGD
jgi:DNA repair exonuclease SbcCD nuclease subunit